MAKSRIAGLPQPRAAKARTVRKVVRLEPAEHRAQVAAANRSGKTWSDWIRWLAAREMCARPGLTVPAADVLRVIRDLVDFPRAEVCRHIVAANLLNVLERNGFPVSVGLARAIVEADDDAAKVHLAILDGVTP